MIYFSYSEVIKNGGLFQKETREIDFSMCRSCEDAYRVVLDFIERWPEKEGFGDLYKISEYDSDDIDDSCEIVLEEIPMTIWQFTDNDRLNIEGFEFVPSRDDRADFLSYTGLRDYMADWLHLNRGQAIAIVIKGLFQRFDFHPFFHIEVLARLYDAAVFATAMATSKGQAVEGIDGWEEGMKVAYGFSFIIDVPDGLRPWGFLPTIAE